ncbi:hypothetical protein [Streptomyces sp. NPDC056069]|uniref:hypothetical protein n=1 Tax=Streptomyces sp. NPDC056069 TaxID=3345702 RepID=UPI0035E0DCCF
MGAMERGIKVDNAAGVVVIGSGNQVGLGVGAGAVVRSAYQEQVRCFAPRELLDREAELAELAAFCRDDRGPAYGWWRAEAWAGKTALLSWFALNPPSGVRIVSFFVTARLGAQNDVVAYVDVVLEQLAELVGEGLPTRLTDATKAGHLMRLYTEASRICAERDERLVLLVDGLDEDRGVTVGADAYSIASLLPYAPTSNTRVIVAGRLNPPLPGDVPQAHPLRAPDVVRILRPSPHAQAVRAEAERELKAFLADGWRSRDLLGLIVASGGGLTAEDLAHLTRTTAYDVKALLRARAGRTFVARDGMAARESYLLAHEELHAHAREMLGEPALEICRMQLHEWSQEYRESGWPPDTPEYLLKGYFQLLRATNDLDRMVDCAVDDARRHRLLDITGNDAAGLAELRATGERIVDRGEARLLDMFRISVRRRALDSRTIRIPASLPAAWVRAGVPLRGELLAQGIPERDERARALTEVGAALAEQGQSERAGTAFATAEKAVREIREAPVRRQVAERLLHECLRTHRFAQAKRLVDAADGLVVWHPEATDVVGRLAELGDTTRVAAVVRALTQRSTPRFDDVVAALAEMGEIPQALVMARSFDVPTWRAISLLRVSGVLRRERSEEARSLVEEALADPSLFGDRIAEALVEAGEVAEGAKRAIALTRGERRSSDFTAIIGALAKAGETATVDLLLTRLHEGVQLSEAAAVAARWAARQGDEDRAMRLARVITDDSDLTLALLAVAGGKVRKGEVDSGLAIARMLAEQDLTAQPVVDIAVVLAECGERELACEALATVESGLRTRPPQHVLHELTVMVEALAGYGLRDEAQRLIDGVETHLAAAARSIQSVRPAGTSIVGDVAKALASTGLFARAEAVAATLAADPDSHDNVLIQIARRMVEYGEFDGAERIARIPVGVSSSRLGPEVARALAAAGEWSRATRVAGLGMAPYHRPWLLAELACLRVDEGSRELAARLVLQARGEERRAPSIRGASALVRASVRVGDQGLARLAKGEAEALLDRVPPSAAALREAVRAWVAMGEYDKATALVEGIAPPSLQAEAQADLVGSLLEYGCAARARAAADSMGNGSGVARAYAVLAHATDEPEARNLLIRGLHRGWWTQCLDAVLRAEPGAVQLVLREAERLRDELGPTEGAHASEGGRSSRALQV